MANSSAFRLSVFGSRFVLLSRLACFFRLILICRLSLSAISYGGALDCGYERYASYVEYHRVQGVDRVFSEGVSARYHSVFLRAVAIFRRWREFHRAAPSVFLDGISYAFIDGSWVREGLTSGGRNGIHVPRWGVHGSDRQGRACHQDFGDKYVHRMVFLDGIYPMTGMLRQFGRSGSLTSSTGAFFGSFGLTFWWTRRISQFITLTVCRLVAFRVLSHQVVARGVPLLFNRSSPRFYRANQ